MAVLQATRVANNFTNCIHTLLWRLPEHHRISSAGADFARDRHDPDSVGRSGDCLRRGGRRERLDYPGGGSWIRPWISRAVHATDIFTVRHLSRGDVRIAMDC